MLLALIIEDDLSVANIYAEALRMAGYEPEIIHNGRDALNRLREVVPTIILLDLHLPEVSGPDIWQRIRAESRLNDTRIIVATADPLLAEEMRDHVDLVLLKPISFVQLRDLAIRIQPK